jgi:hypothetical protein
MRKTPKRACPECGDKVPAEPLDRRDFLRIAGVGATAALALRGVPAVFAQDAKPKPGRAEDLIKELHAGLSDEQKTKVVSKFEDPARMGIYNKAIGKTIGESYTKPQQELVERILRAIAAPDEAAWKQISRGGTWDGSKAFQNCGANIFGDPSTGKYTWVFSGHHLTLRCDGDSEEGAAFGGPLYYGHSPNGYSARNLFNYQTLGVLSVFDALSDSQRKQAVVKGTPGEGPGSIKFRASAEAKPGIPCAELSADQKGLIEKVMRDILSPYRKEDVDEAMQVVKAQGGVDKINLAFYKEEDAVDPKEPWHFWRLEGSGFVWNYRVLPHVHTFVNISAKI